MTSRGNIKQTAAFWAAVAFFITAMLCAIESGNASDPGLLKAFTLIAGFMGVISAIGVWTMGLTKAQTHED